ncbi:MAG: phosphoribosylanthranilate isomerase [Terracidiphilus sp.]
MSLWIKICGNTNLDDAQFAAGAGADAVGFVFAPSPRRVTASQVAAIVPQLPAAVEKIGVFVDASFDEILETVRTGSLTGVQLHAAIGKDTASRLRGEFGAGLRILRVVHFGADAVEQAAAIANDVDVDGILVDSRTATAVGGTGIAFDWAAARSSLFGPQREQRMIAAGGLRPENVAEAIATLRPWGVDVSSGVEAAPGGKDPAKVQAFIANARAAAATK